LSAPKPIMEATIATRMSSINSDLKDLGQSMTQIMPLIDQL